MIEQWRDRAKCRGTDPAEYDVDRTTVWGKTPGPDRWPAWLDRLNEWVQRGTVCDGCPVVALCAADAAEHRDGGVIRGGIPIPHPSGDGIAGPNSKAARHAVALVAAGTDPDAARRWMTTDRITRALHKAGGMANVGALS